MEYIIPLLMGVGFSIASGARVTLAFFIMSLATHFNILDLSSNFEWIGSTPALVLFGVATLVEVVVYYIPVLDSVLDALKVPLTVIAGIVATASFITDFDPMIAWTLSVIAGGGMALTSQATTSTARAFTTTTTGGTTNFLVTTWENIKAIAISLIAIIAPFLIILAVIFTIIVAIIMSFVVKKLLAKIKARKVEKALAI